MSLFPENHYCETLRGFRKLPPSSVLRALAKRCVWLERRIELNAAIGKARDMYVDELAAIIMLVETGMDVTAFRTRLLKFREEAS